MTNPEKACLFEKKYLTATVLFFMFLGIGCKDIETGSPSIKTGKFSTEKTQTELRPCNELTAGKLRMTLGKNGKIKLFDNNVLMLEENYANLFSMKNPKKKNYQENGSKIIILTYETPRGGMTKKIKLSPNGAWIIWDAKARQKTKGGIELSCPQKSLKAPYLYFHPFNRTARTELAEFPKKRNFAPQNKLLAPYCIITDGKGNQKEFQLASSKGCWKVQENSKDTRYNITNYQKLNPGEKLTCLIHYIASPEENYPLVSFDGEVKERGNLHELTSIAEDNFSITLSRSTKYTFTNKSLTVNVNYRSLDSVSRLVNIKYQVVDMNGKIVKKGESKLKSNGKDFASEKIELSFPLNGVYRLELTYAYKNIKRRRETIFAVLPKISPTSFRPDSIFGASIGARGITSMGQAKYFGLLAERCGMKWDRWWNGLGDSRWADLEYKGVKNWKRLDIAYETAQKFKIMTLGVISSNKRVYNNPELMRNMDKLFHENFDKYLELYINDYVIPMATHFKGKIKYWEVGNEPYWRYGETPEKYVKLLKRVYKVLKKIDPEIKVVGTCGPPGSHGFYWYHKTFALGSLKYQDILSCHLYLWSGRSWVGSGRELKIRKWSDQIRKIMRKHGRELPIWNTETTVTPPTTMYTDRTRHKDFIKFVKKYADQTPKDPTELSQMYFKLVLMNFIENIKYFFFVWGGGNEYIFRALEYDLTPFPIVATQAAMAKHLEGAKYIKEIPINKNIQAYLFRSKNSLILIPWGTYFAKDNYAKITIPLPLKMLKAKTIFDNPQKIEGNKSQSSFKVTWLPFFLLIKNTTQQELEKSFASATLNSNFKEKKETSISDKSFAGRKAKSSDWSGFYPIDLANVANRGFKDETVEDQKGGWSDEGENDMRFLKTGEWLLNEVPFKIIAPEKNNGKSCVVLKNYKRPYFPERAKIKVDKRLCKLHFLHTATYGKPKVPAFTYIINFKDGKKQIFEIECGKNVANWYYNSGKLPEAKVAWEGPNPVKNKVRIWQTELDIKHEKGAAAVIESIEIVSKNKSIPIILSITGVYSN